jgi:Protein of unknown function (DUF3306)
MSDSENFIARWSRRKRAAAERVYDEKAPEKASTEKRSEERSPAATSAAAPARSDAPPPELPFDLAKLPSLESITAESDIRAFLAPGVPAELTRAALRRAWSADPKIRDFVGLADYDWDFNTPGAITGFGPLEMTDELRRRVTQMVGRSLAPDDGDQPVPTEAQGPEVPPTETPTESAVAGEVPQLAAERDVGTSQDQAGGRDSGVYNSEQLLQCDKEPAAVQNNLAKPDDSQLIVKRPHGRALPK